MTPLNCSFTYPRPVGQRDGKDAKTMDDLNKAGQCRLVGGNSRGMARIALHIVALAAFSALASSGLEARLVSDRTSGTRRVCVYQAPGVPEARPGSRVAAGSVLRVGLGEPCPQHRPPAPVQRRFEIPAAATLVGVDHGATRTVCHYAYVGNQYSRSVAAGRPCPYVAGAADAELR